MISGYFNYTMHVADGWWDRQRFLRAWWRIYATDSRWAPPYYPSFRNLLRTDRHPHLQRLRPELVHLEALPSRRRHGRSGDGSFGTVLFEEPVAATVLMLESRASPRTAYLGELHVVNDSESLDRFLGLLMEHLWQIGYRRIVGPVGISPVLRSGVLMNHFDITPPMHTPYNPPYVPEVVGTEMKVLENRQLFYIDLPDANSQRTEHVDERSVTISKVGIRDSGSRMLPLLAACCDWSDAFPVPDQDELRYVVRWLASQATVQALVAREHGKMVGIVLLQADQSHRLRRAKGGRNLLWRWWFQWRRRYPVRQGRLILGGVLPEARERGIGSQLWTAALDASREAGWRTLSVGPVALNSTGASVLHRWGARPMQRYCIYANEL